MAYDPYTPIAAALWAGELDLDLREPQLDCGKAQRDRRWWLACLDVADFALSTVHWTTVFVWRR